MGSGDAKSMSTLGFLTVVEHPQYGLFGGYLVLNMAGRPLEFHCTSPIKPNRAQEILYGPTLEGFLYGEQIGQTLLNQGNAQPLVVCTDRQPALATREFISAPMVLVLPTETNAEHSDEPTEYLPAEAALGSVSESQSTAKGEHGGRSKKFFRLDPPHHGGPQLVTFQLGRNHLALPECAVDDRRQIDERLAAVAGSFDLTEPFQRIREAIEEAQQAVR
jgi:hypothetical protein